MPRLYIYKIYFAAFITLIVCSVTFGQDSVAESPEGEKGSIKFTSWIEIDGKLNKTALLRNRFYLIRGSREQNAELLKQISETNVLSRDCYFADLRQKGRKISDEYVCWLKNNECESSYCREITTTEEALSVPEFAAAYRQGLREYKQPTVALKWLNTNLADEIRIGYYRQYQAALQKMVSLARASAQEATRAKRGSAKTGDGFQSIMTDRLANAYFLDVDVVPPEGKKTETYLISNLAPVVIGDSSYVWTCEIEVTAKRQLPVILNREIAKKNKCEVITKKQPENCNLPECGKPVEKQAATN